MTNPHAKAFSIRIDDGLPAENIDELSYVDTNFLLDLNNPQSEFNSHCRNFIQVLEEHDKFIAYSPWVQNEMYRFLRVQYAKSKYNVRRPYEIDSLDLAARKDINTNAFDDVDKFLKSLDHISIKLEAPSEETQESAKTISVQSGMQFDDALHISSGLDNGINSYITNDGGFLDFDNRKNNINVYGASQKISTLHKNNNSNTRLNFEF